jgi:hypothetical protein
MVEMTVGHQQPIDPSKAGAGTQQLTLGAFPTIHQNALATGNPGAVHTVEPAAALRRLM